MPKYHRLTLGDRYQISALKQTGLGVRQIALKLNKSPSTISREFKRVRMSMYLDCAYNAFRSHGHADFLLRNRNVKAKRIVGELKNIIDKKIKFDLSPEQISGQLRKYTCHEISYSSIYRYIYYDALKGGDLWKHLRTQRKKRKLQKQSTLKGNLTNYFKDKVGIEQRPSIVEEKKRLGDWERDTVFGGRTKAVLLTLNDRVSRIVKVSKILHQSAEKVHCATVRRLRKEILYTITNDHGCEFSKFKRTQKLLKTPIYFAHKGKAWQRGANENTNGLLRQYFPRSMDFKSITIAQIRNAENRLNNRPRKCLDYLTPLEYKRRLLGQVLR